MANSYAASALSDKAQSIFSKVVKLRINLTRVSTGAVKKLMPELPLNW